VKGRAGSGVIESNAHVVEGPLNALVLHPPDFYHRCIGALGEGQSESRGLCRWMGTHGPRRMEETPCPSIRAFVARTPWNAPGTCSRAGNVSRCSRMKNAGKRAVAPTASPRSAFTVWS